MVRNKGITLIALVITIIVLLILAGVSIATLTGENGILHQAQRAKEETKIATVEEQRQLAMSEAAMNLENTEYKGVPIPAGFAPTRIEGENTIEDGLVIVDAKGNEFVWIPCDKNEVEETYIKANELSSKWPSYDYNKTTGWVNPEEQIAAGKASIENYGGFYIGRYEAGIPSEASFYPTEEKKDYIRTADLNSGRDVTEENGKALKPVSKKNNPSWNFITQEHAKKVSEKMYEGSSSVNSYLIDSNAWNYICKYIFETKGTKIEDSSEYGNYLDNKKTNYEEIRGWFAKHGNGVWASNYEYGNVPLNFVPRGNRENNNRLELATGICDDFKLYNIYDMAGNMLEWITETVSWSSTGSEKKNYGVLRGGCFLDYGSTSPVTNSSGNTEVLACAVQIGFRCVLYLRPC